MRAALQVLILATRFLARIFWKKESQHFADYYSAGIFMIEVKEDNEKWRRKWRTTRKKEDEMLYIVLIWFWRKMIWFSVLKALFSTFHYLFDVVVQSIFSSEIDRRGSGFGIPSQWTSQIQHIWNTRWEKALKIDPMEIDKCCLAQKLKS